MIICLLLPKRVAREKRIIFATTKSVVTLMNPPQTEAEAEFETETQTQT